MTAPPEPRIERLAEPHFEPLARLFGRVFGRDPGAEHLRRKYAPSLPGIGTICHVAMCRGDAVAFSGMIPQRFRVDGEELLAAHACDYATDPRFRGRGLHRELEERSRQLAEANGVHLIYALLTGQSLAVARRTGWTLLETMRRYAIPVRTLPAARLAFRASRSSWERYGSYASGVIGARHPAADDRANALEREGWLCHSYDADLRRYRSFTCNHRVDLGGATAWIKLAPQLLVGDMDAPDAATVERCLRELRRLAARLGVTEVAFMTCPGTRLDAERFSRLLRPEDAWIVAHLGFKVAVDRLKVNLADYDTF